MIELRIGEMERGRGHLFGVVSAIADGQTIFQDTVRLERADSRRQFAGEVARIAADLGIEVDRGAIERKLLEILDGAAKEADAPGPAAEGLMALLAGQKPSSRLITLADDCRWFHTSDGDAYVVLPVGSHWETWPVDSRTFKDWLQGRYYRKYKDAPTANAMHDALGVLRGRALHESPEQPVFTRLAGLGGAIYLDLGDPEWRAVEIMPGGWRVIAEPPVRFVRPNGMLALPTPTRGGSLEALRRFVNVKRDDDWRLVLSWLSMALRPSGPYVVLLIYGQQGAAKSTVSRVLRSVVDPNRAPVRSRPRDEVDLLIAARGGSVVAFDNLSYLSDDLSDAICRMATGGGVGKRTLYTNGEETILEATRPVILNGIEELARRGDLADRGLALDLPPIPKEQRRPERVFWQEFRVAQPGILGALLDVAVTALAGEAEVMLEGGLPRMADFAVWSAAAAPALGWTPEAFMSAYEGNLQDRDQTVLDDSPLTRFLVELVEDHGEWTGTASELLAELNDRADDRTQKDRRWPKDATRLSSMLRRLTPSLQAVGVGVESFREAGGARTRTVRLWRLPAPETPPDGASHTESEGKDIAASRASRASRDGGDQVGDASFWRDADRDASGTLGDGASVPLAPDRRDARDAGDARLTLPSDIGHGTGKEAVGAGSHGDAATEGAPSAGGGLGAGTGAFAALLSGGLDARDAADQRGLPGSGTAPDDSQDQIPGSGSAAGGHRTAPSRVHVLTAADDVRRAVAGLASLPALGLDTETTGLDSRSHRVRLVQLAAPDGRVYLVDLFSADARLLAPLFDATDGPVLVGHNLKFDLQFLAEAGLPVPNGSRLFDTMLAARLLEASANPEPKGHFSLAGVAARYLGTTLDKAEQTSDWSGPLSDEQLEYAARDAAILPALHAVMTEQLHAADLERVMGLELRALPAVVWLERTGAPFDVAAWTSLAEQAARRLVELEERLADMADAHTLFGDSAVNWSSTQQVKRVLEARGHSLANVTEETLLGLAETDALARLLLEYREQAKRLGTYGLNVLQHVAPSTGRIHADWRQLGSRAGRMSCSRPNLQQVPRAPAYRACFRPADGRVLVKADYSQIELRIAAEIAPDERLLAAYAAGEDVHTLTAAEVLGRRNGSVTPEDRQAAKALNFGLVYGCGGPRLRESARTEYGIELTEADSLKFRRRFFELYPGLRAWHRRQPSDEHAVDTRTPAGRRRLGVTRYTEKLNTPVQGAGADGLKAALALLWETRDRVPGAAPVLVVHDEIVVECDAADAETAGAWLAECMERGMQAFLTQVPAVVEVTVERDWSGTPLGEEVAS
jgi:DNA polymerase-1